jgi:hypothetical protein
MRVVECQGCGRLHQAVRVHGLSRVVLQAVQVAPGRALVPADEGIDHDLRSDLEMLPGERGLMTATGLNGVTLAVRNTIRQVGRIRCRHQDLA